MRCSSSFYPPRGRRVYNIQEVTERPFALLTRMSPLIGMDFSQAAWFDTFYSIRFCVYLKPHFC